MKKRGVIIKISAIVVGLFLIWLVIMWVTTPSGVFRSDYSTLLLSSDGTLMNAHIAKDGQWRFPPTDSVPDKFKVCIINYEDRYFKYHPGINPVSLVKAALRNKRNGRIVSGGSTITMQVSRISSERRERTYLRKFIELNRALYIELCYSKDEILAMYASHAPFGGNIVGVDAASWRYFGTTSDNITWAQAAMLAVLPNSPSLINISRGRDKLLLKRNSLLKSLLERGVIDEIEYSLAIDEPIPDEPEPLPNIAPHLASAMLKSHEGERIRTSIDLGLQKRLQSIADNAAREYTARNNVHNVAILVKEVESGQTIAYIGNASYKADERFCNDVDIIRSPRSTGSILKPVLYAAMLSDGLILPKTLIPDVPLYLNGFSPQNFNKSYSGVVSADEAIIRSLNVPLVRMLRSYGIDRFLKLLRSLGITTMNHDASYYGASLILGGAEATLWDICNMYITLTQELIGNEGTSNSSYSSNSSSLWFMMEAMSKLSRPEEEAEWRQFESMKKIAWKTGTSYGGKDAWAIGMNPHYVVGVWVGNATGEGRAGMTGVGYAAPILFRTFSILPSSGWFEEPYDDMAEEAVCRASGYRATEYCTEAESIPVPQSGTRTAVCPYHKLVHLNKEGNMRVNSNCYSVSDMKNVAWFCLPPVQEYYYSRSHINYRPLPPIMSGCADETDSFIDIIYPDNGAVVYIPKGFDNQLQQVVCEATHINPDATLFWHLDNKFLGSTTDIHNMAIRPSEGRHTLTIVDGDGNSKSVVIKVRSSAE